MRSVKNFLILAVGTFFEYFDLMLYVHMASLLNDVFFAPNNAKNAEVISTIFFCSIYIFRPIGSWAFGYIGDKFGRRSAITLSSIIMAASCVIIGVMPTYAQIGAAAGIMITILRIIQAIASSNELIGAELYLTESIADKQKRYFTVAMIVPFSAMGSVASLGASSFALSSASISWRVLFYLGSLVAILASLCRFYMKETGEFITAIENKDSSKHHPYILYAYFFMESVTPIYFIINYIYGSTILKEMGKTTAEVISHNFILSIAILLNTIFIAGLSAKFHPFKILKIKLPFFLVFSFLSPMLIQSATTENEILFLQLASSIFICSSFPANAIILKHIPVLKRYRYGSIIFALSKAASYTISTFCVSYLTKTLGKISLLIITAPIAVTYSISMLYISRLKEK